MPATIRMGSGGSTVIQWQNLIGEEPADGVFDRSTENLTKDWQKKHDLTADGIVGPQTWAKALGTPAPARPANNIHTQERETIDRALPNLSEREKLALQAVSLLESSYGKGWKPPGNGSKNRGAITGTYEGMGFTYKDSRYDPKTGTVIPYETTFRAYPTDEEAVRDLARVMYDQRPTVRAAAKAGDLEGVSRALRETSYYIGVKPKEQAIQDHYGAMQKRLSTILTATGMSNAFTKLGWFPVAIAAIGSVVSVGLGVLLFRRNIL